MHGKHHLRSFSGMLKTYKLSPAHSHIFVKKVLNLQNGTCTFVMRWLPDENNAMKNVLESFA